MVGIASSFPPSCYYLNFRHWSGLRNCGSCGRGPEFEVRQWP